MEVWCQYCSFSEVNTKFLDGPPPHTVFRFCRNIETEATRVIDHIKGFRTNYKTPQLKLSKLKEKKFNVSVSP